MKRPGMLRGSTTKRLNAIAGLLEQLRESGDFDALQACARYAHNLIEIVDAELLRDFERVKNARKRADA